MGFEVGGRREPLVADITFVRFFTGVHEVVLLQVGQLRETLGTHVTLKGTLSRVSAQVNLEVAQLSKRFIADVALIMHFSIFLLEGIR